MASFDYKKFERLELLALKNAMRLHDDSMKMFKQKSYATAFQLSVLSQEEFGKVLIIEDVVWNRRFNKMNDKWTQEWFNLTTKHNFKQFKVLRDSKFGDPKTMILIQKILNGDLEKQKQGATYAGLTGNMISGRIINPFQITRDKALIQISTLNNDILLLMEKIKNGFWELESELVQKYVKRSLYSKLTRRINTIKNLA